MSNVVIQRKLAYTPVVIPEEGYRVAVAEQDVPGYAIDQAEPLFDSYLAAAERAQKKNEAIGLDKNAAWEIVTSSMAASRDLRRHWEPRGS